MATRAINLKLVVHRAPERLAAARALWTTHQAINLATRHYEQLFLWCRQEPYVTEDGTVDRQQIDANLNEVIEAARKRKGYDGPNEETRTKQQIRSLYEAIVPSSIGKTGSAQNVSSFASPLLDRESKGFTEVFDKLKDLPNWIDGVRAEDPEVIAAANDWLASERGQARLRVKGAPPRWARLARATDPAWVEAFVEDVDRLEKAALGVPALMQELRELGVIPLFPSFFTNKIEDQTGPVSKWDRLAMRLAVAHLMSWESWCIRSAKEHEARTQRLQAFQTVNATGEMVAKLGALRRYESERTVELQEKAALEAEQVRLTARTIRGWRGLRDRWLRHPDAPVEQLVDVIAEEQTRQRGRFGDPHLFRWLAEPENCHVWREKDAVSLFVRLRTMELLVERSRETATMTLPEARLHPRSVQWEPRGGANLKNFNLTQRDRGDLQMAIPLLNPVDGNRFCEEMHDFDLAPSDQLDHVCLSREGKRYVLTYRAATGEDARAVVGSADLLMNWHHLRQRSEERIDVGEIGPAYFKVALDVDLLDPIGDPRRTPPAIHHFRTAAGGSTRHAAGVEEGFRVLSVDLGIRTFATCSIFELRSSADARKLAFLAPGLGLTAVHERSFTLNLPGEEPNAVGKHWREEKDAELRRMRQTLSRYRRLRSLTDAIPEDRKTSLKELIETATEHGWPFEVVKLQGLRSVVSAAEPVWTGKLDQTLHGIRTDFGHILREWRRSNRQRSVDRASGKSMWAIEHLTNVRRFLMSWSLLSERGEISRLDRERWGVFARNLLEHINGLKEDRLKTGADLIVQAARGYRRGPDGKWIKAYDPCHAILFEDLTRYRMRTDRPRRENSQLMRWVHRALPAEVEMQAELHGIHITDTGAAFPSRYHAATMTPGVRMHPIKKSNLSDARFMELVARANLGIDVGRLTAGDLVQLNGGEIFVCKTALGTTRIHADVNAAQNLQRRFWTRHSDAFRVVAKGMTIDGEQVWVPTRMGKRLVGALGGHGRLVPTGHDSGSCRWQSISAAAWRRLSGESAGEDDAGSETDEALAALEEQALEDTGEIVVFFRDPSGVVLPNGLWYPSKTYWSIVKTSTLAAHRRGS